MFTLWNIYGFVCRCYIPFVLRCSAPWQGVGCAAWVFQIHLAARARGKKQVVFFPQVVFDGVFVFFVRRWSRCRCFGLCPPQPFQHHGVYILWFWGTHFRYARLQMGFGQCSPRQDVWRKDGYLEASAHLLGVRAQAGRHERPQGYRESVDSKEVFCLAARHAATESRVCDVFQGRSSVSGGLHDSARSPRLGTGMPECCWHLWNVGSFCKASGRIVWAASRHVQRPRDLLVRGSSWLAEGHACRMDYSKGKHCRFTYG